MIVAVLLLICASSALATYATPVINGGVSYSAPVYSGAISGGTVSMARPATFHSGATHYQQTAPIYQNAPAQFVAEVASPGLHTTSIAHGSSGIYNSGITGYNSGVHYASAPMYNSGVHYASAPISASYSSAMPVRYTSGLQYASAPIGASYSTIPTSFSSGYAPMYGQSMQPGFSAGFSAPGFDMFNSGAIGVGAGAQAGPMEFVGQTMAGGPGISGTGAAFQGLTGSQAMSTGGNIGLSGYQSGAMPFASGFQSGAMPFATGFQSGAVPFASGFQSGAVPFASGFQSGAVPFASGFQAGMPYAPTGYPTSGLFSAGMPAY